MSDTDPLETRFGALVSSLAPAARAALAKRIARELQQSQGKRIAAQQSPDGSAFEPRKPQLRNRKKSLRAGMFVKLRTARFLKASGSDSGAVVRFAAEIERIARVHQLGLRDKVNRRTGLEADYPARQLLGFSDSDKTRIDNLIVEHLSQST